MTKNEALARFDEKFDGVSSAILTMDGERFELGNELKLFLSSMWDEAEREGRQEKLKKRFKEYLADAKEDVDFIRQEAIKEVLEDFPDAKYWDVDDTPTLLEYKQQLKQKYGIK